MYAKFGAVLLVRTYYRLKPLIPWGLRMALRRRLAARLRARCAGSWPIDERAKEVPRNFPGWPDGKRFALVITHDVEGQTGLIRSRRLAELDAGLGFRAAFNFVPEGEYRTPEKLRHWLKMEGMEVGVHDLRHDGRLYDSETEFKEHAVKINGYLREWDAKGFRSGFMLRELDWLHELEIDYDSSTFDTDPFEPQPDGMHTIFPFWRPGPGGKAGYMELPYTLAQDSTLFVLLQERGIEIWKQKLDWIARHGGMALLNVHPDYVCFDGTARPNEFGVNHYLEFLKYARSKHAGEYWQALPREVAGHCRAKMSSS